MAGKPKRKAAAGRRTAARRKPAARKKATARHKAGPAPRKPAAPRRRRHSFMVHRATPQAFRSDGLRAYAHYRDLGVAKATHGMAVAHVIRLVGACDPKVVSKLHLHKAEFQLVYVLKGSITSSFEGEGTHTMHAGDAWLQPHGIRHKVLDYSPDCELLEIVMPADFETVELEQ